MMSAGMIDEGDGVRAARARSRRCWRIAGLAVLGALGIDLILFLGKTGPGQMRPAYAIAAAAAFAIVLPLAVYFKNRTRDELDRLNWLRANSWGLHAWLVGAICWSVLFYGGLVPAPNVMALILVTAVVTLGRYWTLRLGQ